MPVNNPMEMFVRLLSDVRRKTERSIGFFSDLGDIAEIPEIKEALAARAFVAKKSLETIDEAFKLINQEPVTQTSQLEEIFVEDFRREVAEIKVPVVRRFFILSKLVQLAHLRIGEYVVLVAAADTTGNFGVGVLLESCLANHLAFVERSRRVIRKVAELKKAAATATG